MQFFDGKHNRRRRIALRGSSTRPQTAEQILAHAKTARQQRTIQRVRQSSSIVIQKYWRRYSTLIQIAKHQPSQTSSQLTHLVLSSSLLYSPQPKPDYQSNRTHIVQYAFQTHPFIYPLIKSVIHNLAKEKHTHQTITHISNLPPRIIVSTVNLFLAYINYIDWQTDNDLNFVIDTLNNVLFLLQSSNAELDAQLIHLSFTKYLSDVLRKVHSCQKLQPNHLYRNIFDIISKISIIFIQKIPSEDQTHVLSTIAYRQIAICFLPIENVITYTPIFKDESVLQNIVHSLVPSKLLEEETYSNEDLKRLSQIDLTIFLSNLLHLCSDIWMNNNGQLLWPSVSVLSQLVRLIPEDALSMTEMDNDDDMDTDTDEESDMNKNIMRSALLNLTNILEQIVTDDKIRTLFARAVDEGRQATAQVCYLFDFLARQKQNLASILKTTLALWKRPRKQRQENHMLKSLWNYCLIDDPNSSSSSLIQQLDSEMGPILSLFVRAYRYLISIQDIDEILGSTWPFTLKEIREVISVLKPYLFAALYSKRPALSTTSSFAQKANFIWQEKGLVTNISKLLTRLHVCDSQKRIATDDNFWLITNSAVSTETFLKEASEAGPGALMRSVDDLEESYHSISSKTLNRAGAVLCVAPFLVPFSLRAKVFNSWIKEMRNDSYSRQFLPFTDRTVSIRRDHIFEDAFENFNGLGEGLRSRVRVQFIDEYGLDEAGIDGGGVFKEFMHEVLKQGFAPYPYQFFIETSTKRLYPNPNAHIANENYQTYFEFLGRLLGKAVFDGIPADLPFARFFLSSLLGQANSPSDLEFLDPEMYRNLKKLKDYDSEVIESLSLYFVMSNEVYGTTKEVELVRNGRNIQVTAANRIIYIYRVARYRLTTQIKKQTEAFIKGFSEVIPLQYVRIFFHDELQLLISGKPGKIDLQDWRRHTKYSGGYDDTTPVIEWFWQALSELNAEEQGKVLQFVTSSPRPPLLGFSYLIPNFCIRRAEGDVRLPTASTCVNLLKLPRYSSLEMVREKLRYAVEANAGFDLS